MLDQKEISNLVNGYLESTDYYLVSVSISPDSRVEVVIDRNEGVSLDFCAELNAYLNGKLDRDIEDYELEVSSAGLTSPLLVKRQYDKNIGNPVIVYTSDGRKLRGTLTEATDTDFAITYDVKIAEEGKKHKVTTRQTERIEYSRAKQVTYDLVF